MFQILLNTSEKSGTVMYLVVLARSASAGDR